MTTAIILAGGLGTRLRSVVPDLPKPMAPINGRPFLACLMDYWMGQDVQHFVLSVGYRHQVIMEFFGSSYRGAQLDYVIEETPLGTGGGLLLAAQKVPNGQAFLVLNGDTYFEVKRTSLEEFAQASEADCCFSLFKAEESGRYMGMEINARGQITSLQSGSGQPGRLANGGVYWMHPRTLERIAFKPGDKVSLEDGIFPAALSAGYKLLGLACDGAFIDIGVPADYQRAPQFLASSSGLSS